MSTFKLFVLNLVLKGLDLLTTFIVVGKVGTATVSQEELIRVL